MSLSDLEFDVLNALYFVEPFEKVLEEVDAPANVVGDVLKGLIAKDMVTPMKWDGKNQAYVRSFIYDSDNMHAYRYLATKKGLMAHNSR